MLQIKPVNVKQIFKSDLEADQMLNIFKFFLDQDKDFVVSHRAWMVDFVSAMQSVKPFSLTCEFLMEDETIVIKQLMAKLNDDTLRQNFTKASGIDFW